MTRVLPFLLVLALPIVVAAQAPPMTSVTAGDNHNCGLTREGGVHCWGMRAVGRTIAPSGRFRQIDAGNVLTCGVREDDRSIACWGGGVTRRAACRRAASRRSPSPAVSRAPSGRTAASRAGWCSTR